jgi:DNA anti-recombination protein RmuC
MSRVSGGVSARYGGRGAYERLARGVVEVDLRDFRMSLDQKLDKLDARFVQLNTHFDAKFEQQNAKWDAKFEQQNAKWDARFEQQNAKWDARFEQQDARWDARFEKLDAKWDARLEKLFDRLDAKINGVDAKFERKLEAMSTRRFAVWLTLISSVATITAAALAFIFGSPHGH